MPNSAIYRTIGHGKVRAFRKKVWTYWKKHGRCELAWRKLESLPTGRQAYRILVSEVMLQQTQVSRVSEKYPEFLKAFPTVQKLARAPLGRVLKMWSGMGYNRRAKCLRDAAKVIVEKYNGKIPRSRKGLEELPGIGAYTAGAVRVFAFNEPDVLIETNIRAAYINHFFLSRRRLDKKITDSELLPIIRKAAKGQDPREWHSALMDYGAHIKKLHKNPSRRSAHYTKQSKFEGSLRQVRGAILRTLVDGAKTQQSIYMLIRANMEYHTPSSLGRNESKLSSRTLASRRKQIIDKALVSLERDGLIKSKNGKWRVC